MSPVLRGSKYREIVYWSVPDIKIGRHKVSENTGRPERDFLGTLFSQKLYSSLSLYLTLSSNNSNDFKNTSRLEIYSDISDIFYLKNI